jgi:vacuolar protein sorting-associated protein IST1
VFLLFSRRRLCRRNKLKIERKEIAALLRDKKFDKARIKVESVIRETREGEAGEILELMCDLLVQRITLISNEKACPSDMQECVQTVIWAAPRSQCEEMRVVREQLILKYGEQWCAPAVRGEGEGCRVNEKIKARLTVSLLRRGSRRK